MRDERKSKPAASKARSGRLGRLWPGRAAGQGSPAARDDSRAQDWRRMIRRRTIVAFGCVGLWIGVVEARLVNLQVVRHDHFTAAARRQQEAQLSIEALRGDIVDRNGHLLAYSARAYAIFADPSMIDDADETVAAVCRALGDCTPKEERDLANRLKGPGQYVSVRRSRQVTPAQVDRVAALDLSGIGLERDAVRYYPQGSLGSHILGYVGRDNAGQAGIEYALDREIRGAPGVGHAQVDNRRRSLETRIDREPIPGANIELTIDTRLQHIAERALMNGVERTRARGGVAIVVNPSNGEIYALASYPTFDPNLISLYSDDQRRNRAIEDVYEPGSTFKMVTAAAALQERIVSPHELIDTNPGMYKFPGRKPITEASRHNYGVLTFEEAIVKSSNVAAVKVGLRVGKELMTRYVHRFGFTDRASRDFPGGQSRGIFNAAALNDSGLGSVSMGYQIAVTPLQMVAAVGAIANGGLLIEPRVVRSIERDGVRQRVQPTVVRRAIDEDVAEVLRGMLRGVVTRGTAKTVQIAGYQAAGKTGTSQRALPTGGYSSTDVNASFAGFVPADRPELAILVWIESPRIGEYGGTVAGPVFREIAEASLLQLGVAPEGDGHTPMSVRATPPTGNPPTSRLVRVADRPAVIRTGGPMVMPDVRGLSMRDALRVLARTGMVPVATGAGFVASQSPAPGAPIDAGAVTMLSLRRDAFGDGDLR